MWFLWRYVLGTRPACQKRTYFQLLFFFSFYSVNRFFTVYFVMQFYLFIFSLCFTAGCFDSQVICPDLPNGFCSAHFYWSWQNCRRSCGFCSGKHSTPKFLPVQSIYVGSKDGTYGWVPIQPSQPKQAVFRTGFDFTVFFSGILQFQLVRSLTRRWTYCINYVSQLFIYHKLTITCMTWVWHQQID